MTDHVEQHIDAYGLTRIFYQLAYRNRILCPVETHQSAMTDHKLVLATGSLDQVYLDEHLDHPILAAVKLLNLNQDHIKAFVKEASPVFRLPYPHILPLLALGMSPDDIAYLVMDYALNSTLRSQRLPRRPSAALFSLSLPSTTTLPQLMQVQDTSTIPIQRDSLLCASAHPASDVLPSAVILPNEHQPALAIPPTPSLPTTVSDPTPQGLSERLNPHTSSQFTYYNSSILLPTAIEPTAFSSSLASPPVPPRHGFVPFQPPIARHALIRKIEFLSVGLLLLLATGSMLFTLTMGIKLVKFPFLATTPPLAPKYVTATAVARAYTAYTTDTKKNGFMFGFDPAHTRWNPHEKVLSKATVRHLKPRWSYATDNAIYSSPAVANGMIYIGSEDHNLYAFNASCHSDCQPLWSYTTGGIIYSSPAVANGLVYVGSYDHNLYVFDASCRSACQPLWSYTTGNAIVSSPTIANGMVYVGSYDHNLYAFDASCRSACQPLWSYTTDGYIYSSPAVANGMVYVGSYDHKLSAFDASCRSTCQPLWSYTTDDAISSSPAIANGMVYVGSWDHKLYAFDASCRSTCQPLWSYATGDAISSSPAIANDLVYTNSEDGKLYAFDASCRSTCQPLWSYAMGNIIISSPTVANGIVYVSSDDDGLYAFDATCRHTCQPLWSYATEGPIDSSPVIANGVVYIGSYDRKLYAFGITTK